MKVSVFSEAFHSQYLRSTTLECQHETGKHGLAVEKNGASSAFSQFTAVLRARVTEIFAQYLQQSLVRREGDISFFAVQSESYLCRFLRFDGQCGHVQAPPESITGPMRAFSLLAKRARAQSEAYPCQRRAAVEHLVCPANLGSDSPQIFPRSPPRLAVPRG